MAFSKLNLFEPHQLESDLKKNNERLLNKAIALSIEQSTQASKAYNRSIKFSTAIGVLLLFLFLLEVFRILYEILVCSPSN